MQKFSLISKKKKKIMDKTFFNVLIGPFIIFCIIYLILAILCFLRLFMLKRSPNALKIGKLFYLNILLTCLYRSISSAISIYFAIAFQRDSSPISVDDFNIMFLDVLYIPDIFIWASFAFLYCQLIVLFYRGHLQKSYEDFNISNNERFQFNSLHVLLLFISFVSCIQIIFTTLASTRTITISFFLIENAIFTLIIPLVLLITEFHLHCTFSGMPYLSLFASQNKERINKSIIYWGFARTLHGVVDILLVTYGLENFNDILLKSSTYSDFLVGLFVLIGEKIITEIVPYLLVFDKDFMTIFLTKIEADPNSSIDQENLLNKNENRTILNEIASNKAINENKQISFSSMEDYQANTVPRIDINLISCERNSKEMKRERGLGAIRIGNLFKDRIFKLCIREIVIKNSKYIMEETFRDLAILSSLQNEYQELLVKIKGYDFNLKEDKIYLYYECVALGSLFAFIHGTKQNFLDKKLKFLNSFEEKVRFSLELAKTLEILHSLEPPLIHGHLSSHNILIDKNLKPKISDFLLNSFKKYAGVMTNYSNKTQYTAPEYLEDKGNVVQNCRKPGDVYSYGMILWEIFTDKEPFQDITLKKLSDLVVKEKSRPKIPEKIPEEIANIIRVCWQHDEEKRPEFSALVRNIENLVDLNENEKRDADWKGTL